MAASKVENRARGVAVWARSRLVVGRVPQPPSRLVVTLATLVGVLAVIVAGAGLLWTGEGEAFRFETVGGRTVEIFGRGLYADNTTFQVGGNWGSDMVTLSFGLPLLVVSGILYVRGSLRGHLVLLGTLGYFLYYGVSYALGAVAYNDLFLVYTVLFSVSLFAVIVTFADLDASRLRVSQRMPEKWVGGFMIASGIFTLAVWMVDPVTSILSGGVPASLGAQTTLFTHALDIAVIAPTAVLAGWMILRRLTLGYVVACLLLILEAALLPMISFATFAQLRLGINFTAAQIIGPIAGFTAIAMAALAVIVIVIRNLSRATPDLPARLASWPVERPRR